MSNMSKPIDHDEPFLARWARRKRDAQSQSPQAGSEDAQSPTVAGLDPSPEGAREVEAEKELDLSKLPKVEELTADSDISAFLDKRVPQLLRNAALGRMWALDPTIRDFIEVAENQWNWNVPGGAPFYEEMLTVPGELGQAVARAGGEAGRLLAGQTQQAGAGLAQPSIADDIRLKNQSEDGGVEGQAVAAQDDPGTPFVVAEVESSGEAKSLVTDQAERDRSAAMQQFDRPIPESRKRHGGALPT
jgi:hypothetical protein